MIKHLQKNVKIHKFIFFCEKNYRYACMHVCVYMYTYMSYISGRPVRQIFPSSTERGARCYPLQRRMPNGNDNFLMRGLVEGNGPTGSGRCGHLCEDPRALWGDLSFRGLWWWWGEQWRQEDMRKGLVCNKYVLIHDKEHEFYPLKAWGGIQSF